MINWIEKNIGKDVSQHAPAIRIGANGESKIMYLNHPARVRLSTRYIKIGIDDENGVLIVKCVSSKTQESFSVAGKKDHTGSFGSQALRRWFEANGIRRLEGDWNEELDALVFPLPAQA